LKPAQETEQRPSNLYGPRGVLALAFAIAVSMAASHGAAANDNCRCLEALSVQYTGVELNADQKNLKQKLVVWYNKNCRSDQSAKAN
jgi:hypothetical protein